MIPNTQRASTIWYHDHSLGMTRLNVYAGPAGFYIVRGGPAGDGAVRDSRTGQTAVLPGPAPKEGDKFPANKTYYEIPIAIQDRSFNTDGSLFYPDTRAFFDGVDGPHLPETDLSPIWNPEFFGNMMMINGNTWPFQTVEQRRYRFRFLNGCDSRFLILDFTNVPVGNFVLGNIGPDEPFGGGEPPGDFDFADPDSTGQILQFRVIPAVAADPTTPPQFLQLPAIAPPVTAGATVRRLALVEMMSEFFPESPAEAMMGVVTGDPNAGPATVEHKMWMDPVTENPAVGAVEVWKIYNTTGDAHPMHVHDVVFQVVKRQGIFVNEMGAETEGGMAPTVQIMPGSVPQPPEPWENGFKETVIAFPGQVTRVVMRFPKAGQFVWHCHIVEHEDNEMMRPYVVGTLPSPTGPVIGAAQADGEVDAEDTKVFLPEIKQ